MGLPTDPTLRPIFKWTVGRTFTAADAGGSPWNFGSTPVTTTTHVDVSPDCAVEFVPRATLAGGTSIGHFDTPRVIITILDVDFPSIEGADTVLLGQNLYHVDFVAPPTGLFSVTVFSIHLSAVDES